MGQVLLGNPVLLGHASPLEVANGRRRAPILEFQQWNHNLLAEFPLRITARSKIMHVERSGQVVETAREARGAEPGPTILKVLLFSTTAVIVGFAAIYFAFLS
jgi:hypothetical protein